MGAFITYAKAQIAKYPTQPLPTLAPTSTPMPTPSPTATPKPYVNPDPITDCVSSYPNCNGESIRLKKSQCSNITCCQVGSTWSVYSSTEKCKEVQNSVQTTQQTQQTAQYHCYNAGTGAWYYTSVEQCNTDNARSVASNNCMTASDTKVKTCDSSCNGDMSNDSNICAWAYTGSSATIEQNNDKYSECLNEALEKQKSCLQKCTDQQEQDLKQCS